MLWTDGALGSVRGVCPRDASVSGGGWTWLHNPESPTEGRPLPMEPFKRFNFFDDRKKKKTPTLFVKGEHLFRLFPRREPRA